uniref:Uncharacterized protein n=1 Tax=Panagrolaimus davidi TaxID=227884 RepID=A0A914QTG6_9BILA
MHASMQGEEIGGSPKAQKQSRKGFLRQKTCSKSQRDTVLYKVKFEPNKKSKCDDVKDWRKPPKLVVRASNTNMVVEKDTVADCKNRAIPKEFKKLKQRGRSRFTDETPKEARRKSREHFH